MDSLVNQLVRRRWAVALRGVLAIVFALFAFLLPAITLSTLIILFGVFAILDGMFLIVAAARTAKWPASVWGTLLLEGVIGLIFGVVAVAAPLTVAIVVLYLIAAWAIVTGVIEIGAAVRLRKEMSNEWSLILTGVTSVLLGIVLAAEPRAGIVAWAWLMGLYALIAGVLMISLAWRLRELGRDIQHHDVLTQH